MERYPCPEKKLQHYGFSRDAILMRDYDQALTESKQHAKSLGFKWINLLYTGIGS